MSDVYVLDACALIALLKKEAGGATVLSAYSDAFFGKAKIVMNAVNLLEVYYGLYRANGKAVADKMATNVRASVINVVDTVDSDLSAEAGRLKATYKISLADAIAVAQTKMMDGIFLTSDHHELEVVDENEPVRFLWIR